MDYLYAALPAVIIVVCWLVADKMLASGRLKDIEDRLKRLETSGRDE